VVSVNSVNYDGIAVQTGSQHQQSQQEKSQTSQEKMTDKQALAQASGEKKDHSVVITPKAATPIGKNANNLLSFARNEKAQKALRKAFKLAHLHANFLQEKGWYTVSNSCISFLYLLCIYFISFLLYLVDCEKYIRIFST
jgi:hypothetical protein